MGVFLFGISAMSAGCQDGQNDQNGQSDQNEPWAEGATACPADTFVAAVHGGLFYFEHGSPEEAREALALAERLAVHGSDPTGRALLEGLRSVADSIDADPAVAHLEVERLRMALGDWRCLDEDLHRALHEELPPIPSAPASVQPGSP